MFNHVNLDLQPLDRETIDGVRFYKIPNEDELIKISFYHINYQSF